MKPSIMAIDDELPYLGLIRLFLTPSYDVTTIEGGASAIEHLKASTIPVDAILLDLMMPDLHGLDVLYFIRNHPLFHEVPVILQTATPNEDEVYQGFTLGASACIRKPYTVTELLDVLAGLLHSH